MWENIAGAKRYSGPRGFNIAGASAPVAPAVPTPLVLPLPDWYNQPVTDNIATKSPVTEDNCMQLINVLLLASCDVTCAYIVQL